MERLNRYRTELEIVSKVIPIIAKYENKKITKHIATSVQKEFPNLRVWLSDEYGMYHLKLWSKDFSSTMEISMLLGYRSSNKYKENIIVMEQVNSFNQCYLLHEGRIPRLEEGLKHIQEIVKLRDEALEKMDKVIKLAEKYEMDYDFELEK